MWVINIKYSTGHTVRRVEVRVSGTKLRFTGNHLFQKSDTIINWDRLDVTKVR